ncbi:MAG TPA: DUF5615 family PIN-like protein [Thermoanaerobaculia bacterium]|nr:DUF5615 family PIN-like protein [Thermoanaerobaculia bacterium]
MAHFLVDEDLSRKLAPTLRALGVQAEDVRDLGLAATADDVILEYAITHRRTLVTADIQFANTIEIADSRHPGVVLVRYPSEVSVRRINEELASVLAPMAGDELTSQLVVLEPGGVRTRRRLT